MNLEGQIEIDVLLTPDGSKHVAITNNRPVHAARILVGKSIDEALRTIPLLFHICGKAQGFAAVQALLSAKFKQKPHNLPEDIKRIYVGLLLLTDIEMLREHMLRIFMDWPALLAPHLNSSDIDSGRYEVLYPKIISLGQDFETALFGHHAPFSMQTQLDISEDKLERANRTLSELLSSHIFGCTIEKWATAKPREIIRQWTTKSEALPARVCHEIIKHDWSNEGVVPVKFLPALSAKDCEELLFPASMPETFFPETDVKMSGMSPLLSTPTWNGQSAETTSLSRHSQQGLISHIISLSGAGLLARHFSRLVEIAFVFLRIRRNIRSLLTKGTDAFFPKSIGSNVFQNLMNGNDSPSPGAHQTNTLDHAVTLQRGVGLVEASRGLLMHGALIEGEEVKDYRILAPTEWNFHPKGALANSISNIRGTDACYVKMMAGFLISSIDPCTATKLEVRHA